MMTFEPEPAPEASRLSRTTNARWLLAGVILAVGMGVVLVAPPPAAVPALAVLLVAGVVIAARDAGASPAGIGAAVRGLSNPGPGRLRAALARSDARWAVLAAVVAWLLMIQAAALFRPASARDDLDDGLAWMLAGVAAFGVALFLCRRLAWKVARAAFIPADRALTPAHSDGGRTAAGVGLLALVAAINARPEGLPLLATVMTHVQFVLMVAGMGLLVWGMSGRTPRREKPVRKEGDDAGEASNEGEAGNEGATEGESGRGGEARSAGGERQEGEACLAPTYDYVGYARLGERLKGRHITILWDWPLRTAISGWDWALAAILVVGLVARVWDLDGSIRTLVDEIHYVDGVLFLSRTPNQPILAATSAYTPTTIVYTYLQSAITGVFGQSLGTLRLLSALVGALTVPALYLLARTLFDRRVGLIAALVLATFPPHVHFSRLALSHVADPLVGTLMLAFLLRGIRHNRRLDWALCGLCLGLTQYFYEAGRLLFPPLFVASVGLMALGFRGHLKAQWHGLTVAALVAALLALPVYSTMLANDLPRTSRLSDTGVGQAYWSGLLENGIDETEARQLFDRVTLPFQVYVHQTEQAVYYGGAQALILEGLVPVFLIGLAFVVWRARTPAFILLLWLIATALGNTLVRDPAQYPRYVVAFPAVALVMALGLRYGVALVLAGWLQGEMQSQSDRAATQGTRWRLRPATVVMAVVALVIGVAQVAYYAGPHLRLLNGQLRTAVAHPDTSDAVLRTRDLPPGTEAILISRVFADINPPRNFLGFLELGRREHTLNTLTVEQVTFDYLAALPRDRSYAFFVEPGNPSVVALIAATFDVLPPEGSPNDVPLDKAYVMYFAPRTAAVG